MIIFNRLVGSKKTIGNCNKNQQKQPEKLGNEKPEYGAFKTIV